MWTELYPDDVQAHTIMAQRYKFNNEFDKAKKELNIILQLSPDDFNTIKNLGSTYQQTGQFDSALIYYKQYAHQFPTDPDSYLSVGDCYIQLVDYSKARESYNKALLIDDGNTTIINKIAQLDLKEGRFDEARDRLENV